MPAAKIWSEAYYEPFVQNIVALFHSIPLAVIGWLIADDFGWQSVQILLLSTIALPTFARGLLILPLTWLLTLMVGHAHHTINFD